MHDFEYAIPANPQEAIAQANRLQRARKIIEEGYTFTLEPSGMVAVCKPGQLFASYWIGEHVDGTNGCDCPDAAKGNDCKHLLAWNLLQTREADEAADEARMWEAQCRQWEEETEELPEYDATRILMVAELRRAERGLQQTRGTAAAAGWNKRVQECEIALKMYDEVETKVMINFYKRVPDAMNFPAH